MFWYNRNNHFSANDWFNNQAGVGRPFLNQNQFGGDIGGPIRKDKLFFYVNYEAVRAHQQMPAAISPCSPPDARNGIFTYRLRRRRQQGQPARRSAEPDRGGSRACSPSAGAGSHRPSQQHRCRATAATPPATASTSATTQLRDNLTGKMDYNITTRHAVSGTYAWNRDNSDRPDAENDFSAIPKVTNPTHADFVAVSWRWTPRRDSPTKSAAASI